MQEDKTEEYKHCIADVFMLHAREKLGQMLGFLCEKAQLSQSELGRRSIKYRDYLLESGYLPTEKGTVDQGAISRAIAGKQPSYTQVYVWLRMLGQEFESDEYKKKCERMNEKPYELTQAFEDDMWHLASYLPPRKVLEAYERHKHIMY